MHDEYALRHAIVALRLYLDQIVLIGGWVPYLYQRYGGFGHWDAALSYTTELDVLVPHTLLARTDTSLVDGLRQAGFTPIIERQNPAIWVDDRVPGSKIEFLVSHIGTAKQIGTIQPVTGQQGLGGISLPELDVMARHTRLLSIPIGKMDSGALVTVDIQVPLLGAYVLNKAATFAKRMSSASGAMNPKRAKDLLYLRDVMAAGREVVAQVEQDFEYIRRSDATARILRRSAYRNIQKVIQSQSNEEINVVAQMLVERDGVALRLANLDITGHLRDLQEILAE